MSNENGVCLRANKYALVVTTILAGFNSNISYANVDSNSFVIEDIVVTAQRKSESLQDVPFSIAAFTEDQLAKRGAVDLASFARSVSGLSVTDLGPGQTQISIRGITTGQVFRDEPFKKESVGVYVDEIPVSNARYTPDLDFFDIQRVEVLRGPQGTLYGAGSLSGTMRVVTNQPDPGALAGAVDFKASTTKKGDESYSVKGMINAPLVKDILALRVVGYGDFSGGVIDNIALGEKDVDSSKRYGTRIAARLNVNDRLSITPSLHVNRLETNGFPLEDTLNFPRSIEAGELEQYRELEEGIDDRLTIVNLTMSYDLDWAELVSSTSHIDRNFKVRRDLSLFFDLPIIPVPDQLLPLDGNTKLNNFIQEVRLSSQNNEKFEWIFGLFYSEDKKYFSQRILSPGLDDALGIDSMADFAAPAADTASFNEFNLDLEKKAVFGEITYHITQDFSVKAGLRWFDSKETADQRLTGLFAGGLITRSGTVSEDGVNPRFIVSYQPNDDILLSAQASRGFRLGGINDPVLEGLCRPFLDQLFGEGGNAPTDFKSEKLWNYEVAAKTAWLDRRLIVNGSAYYIEYKDLQQSVRLPCSSQFTGNVGEATSKGLELEVTARPTQALSVGFTVSYTDTKLKSLGGFQAFVSASDGDPLPLSPKWSAGANVGYVRPLWDQIDGFIDVYYQYSGSVVQFLGEGIKTDPYHIAGFRTGVATENWELAFFVDNLFDERAELFFDREFVGAGPDGMNGRNSVSRNRPRTIGVNIKANF